MTWLKEWSSVAEAARERAERETCDRCGGVQTVGYSNLGIPVVACPACQPDLVATGGRLVGDVFGFQESS